MLCRCVTTCTCSCTKKICLELQPKDESHIQFFLAIQHFGMLKNCMQHSDGKHVPNIKKILHTSTMRQYILRTMVKTNAVDSRVFSFCNTVGVQFFFIQNDTLILRCFLIFNVFHQDDYAFQTLKWDFHTKIVVSWCIPHVRIKSNAIYVCALCSVHICFSRWWWLIFSFYTAFKWA